MKYRTLADLAPVAAIEPIGPEPPRARRRRRLERLATVLEEHAGTIHLLSRVEYYSRRERPLLRASGSPLEIAYRDPALREDGLASDRIGDAVQFFDLSWEQAHHLFCDCHYAGRVTGRAVAERVRQEASRKSLREIWDGIRNFVTARFATRPAI